MFKHLCQFLWADDGATAVEYAVIMALILLVILGAIGTVGSQTGGMWGNIQTKAIGAGLGS